MTAPSLGSPIVLTHGVLGFSRMEIGGFTLASYFREIPEFLEQFGNKVFLTAVPPAGSIIARAEALKREIHKFSRSEPIHIIAHSMGGLDSRHMITHLDMASQVLSLTTLGTPHRGTALADQGVAFAESLNLFRWLQWFGITAEAFFQLRTEACGQFNEETPDVEGVRYFSVAGEKKREEMFYPLRFCHDVIAPEEGPNDGLVSVSSARWGSSSSVWNCDHLNLVGWIGPRERVSGFSYDVKAGYTEILERLASWRDDEDSRDS